MSLLLLEVRSFFKMCKMVSSIELILSLIVLMTLLTYLLGLDLFF